MKTGEISGSYSKYNILEEHLTKVDSMHQREWDEGLPIFLLAYRPSTDETRGTTPGSMVFRRELHLPYDLLFGVPPQQGAVYDQLYGGLCGSAA
jgi:hypothetical protein